MVKKYGQTVLVTQDLALANYLDRYVTDSFASIATLKGDIRILTQVQSGYDTSFGRPNQLIDSCSTEWLLTGSVTQLVLAIISKDTRTPLERWVFDIKLVEPPADSKEPYGLPLRVGSALMLLQDAAQARV
jgi:mitotic spindle assembly checkpoint protein MAD2